jgi:hypothetical protein
VLSPDSSAMAASSSPFYSLTPEGRSMKQKWPMKRSKGASGAGAGTIIPIIQKLCGSRRMSTQRNKAKGRKPQPLLSSTCNSSPDMTLITVPSSIMPGGQLKISPLMPYLVKSSSSDTLNTSSTSISSLSDDSCGDFPSVVFHATLKEVQECNQDNMILWDDLNGSSSAGTERDHVLCNDGDEDDGGFWSSTNEFREANQDEFCWFESTSDYYNQATRKQRRRNDADRVCEHRLNIIVEKLSPRTEETIVSSEDGVNSNVSVLSKSDDGSFVSAVDSDSFVSAIMIMSSNEDNETTTKSSENLPSSPICKNHIKSDLPILAFRWGVTFAAKTS